jgi:hypothetical protein
VDLMEDLMEDLMVDLLIIIFIASFQNEVLLFYFLLPINP